MGQHRFSRSTERLLWLPPVAAVYACYFPLSRWTEALPGRTLSTPIDELVPLAPIWMYVYALVFLAGFLPLFVVADRMLFRRVIAAFVTVELCGFTIFALFPVHMVGRIEDVPVTSLATWGLRFTYHVDAPSNLFPSMHVALAVLAALCCWKVDRLMGGGAGVVAALIAASTLLVKQHWLADVVAGAALGFVVWGVFVARFPTPTEGAEGAPRHPRWVSLVPAVGFGGAVLCCWLLYRSGYAPWEAAG